MYLISVYQCTQDQDEEFQHDSVCHSIICDDDTSFPVLLFHVV